MKDWIFIILTIFCVIAIPIYVTIAITIKFGWKDTMEFWKEVIKDLKTNN